MPGKKATDAARRDILMRTLGMKTPGGDAHGNYLMTRGDEERMCRGMVEDGLMSVAETRRMTGGGTAFKATREGLATVRATAEGGPAVDVRKKDPARRREPSALMRRLYPEVYGKKSTPLAAARRDPFADAEKARPDPFEGKASSTAPTPHAPRPAARDGSNDPSHGM